MRHTSVAALLAFCAVASVLSPAIAADEDRAMALDLFEHGRTLLKQGDYPAALTQFEAAAKAMRTFGILLNIAECQEKLGRTASAWATWREARAVASEGHRADDETLASERQKAVEPALSRLTIVVPQGADAADLEVRRDGVVVPREAWGRPIAVDPGRHPIEARASGRKTWSFDVFVPGNAANQTVTIAPLQSDPVPPARSSPIAEEAARPPVSVQAAPATMTLPASPVAPAQEGSGVSGQRVAGWILGGFGIAGVGAGIAIALAGQSQHNDAVTTDLAGNISKAQGMEAQADMTKNVGYVTLGGGGAFLITGLVLALTAPSSSRATAFNSVSVSPWVFSAGGGGAALWRVW